jgi:hypothetical protein
MNLIPKRKMVESRARVWAFDLLCLFFSSSSVRPFFHPSKSCTFLKIHSNCLAYDLISRFVETKIPVLYEMDLKNSLKHSLLLLLLLLSGSDLEPTQPPIQRVPGVLSLAVKRPGREADHSPPPSAEVKNVWSYTSTPQYVFMAWCSV